MCTVTWLHTAEGYELLSNRDERRTRPPAAPPRAVEVDGVRVLSPADGAAGGSWLTVNELGVSLCLLNLYEVEVPPAPRGGGEYTSRGALVARLSALAEAPALEAGLETFDLDRFRPFTLLAIDAAGGARIARWDGSGLVFQAPDGALPLVSSGYDVAGATAARRSLLASLEAEAGGLSAELLAHFHRSHEPERGPYSPCMHRWDAETVSFSWVTVDRRQALYRYAAGAPCEAGLAAPRALPRRRG